MRKCRTYCTGANAEDVLRSGGRETRRGEEATGGSVGVAVGAAEGVTGTVEGEGGLVGNSVDDSSAKVPYVCQQKEADPVPPLPEAGEVGAAALEDVVAGRTAVVVGLGVEPPLLPPVDGRH
jgi:hypothetical protein